MRVRIIFYSATHTTYPFSSVGPIIQVVRRPEWRVSVGVEWSGVARCLLIVICALYTPAGLVGIFHRFPCSVSTDSGWGFQTIDCRNARALKAVHFSALSSIVLYPQCAERSIWNAHGHQMTIQGVSEYVMVSKLVGTIKLPRATLNEQISRLMCSFDSFVSKIMVIMMNDWTIASRIALC